MIMFISVQFTKDKNSKRYTNFHVLTKMTAGLCKFGLFFQNQILRFFLNIQRQTMIPHITQRKIRKKYATDLERKRLASGNSK